MVAEKPGSEFQNPFVNPLTKELKAEAFAVTHPLGGCRMANSAAEGVCDEFGRVRQEQVWLAAFLRRALHCRRIDHADAPGNQPFVDDQHNLFADCGKHYQ
jgi:hypothetical protein